MAVLQKIQAPLLSVNDSILTVVEISFENGHHVKKGDLLMVFETSKTTFDVISESEGYVQYNCISGNDYEVSDVVAIIFSTIEEVSSQHPEIEREVTTFNVEVKSTLKDWEGESVFSKSAIVFMQDKHLDKELFRGRDFISKEDVEKFLGIAEKPIITANQKISKKLIKSPIINSDHVILGKISTAKRREIEYLSDVQLTGLTSTVNTLIETEGIFYWTNQSLRYFKNSLLPLIIYESARLLKKYPAFNAYFNNDQIAFYKEVNIGFAIDIDKGLKVVKIPLAGESPVSYLEEQILLLSEKYIDDKLEIEDLSNISFTITDLSAEGVFSFRPLVNRMNSAILGVSSIDEKLQRCILSLTFDHRVSDGKAASRFLSELKQRMESYRGNVNELRRDHIICYKCFKSLKDELGDVGFVKCITDQGKEAFICQSCLKGF